MVDQRRVALLPEASEIPGRQSLTISEFGRALPGPLARRPARCPQAGDSRFALQIDGFGISNGSPGHWIPFLSRQRIQMPPALNGAVGGEKSDQTLTRIRAGGLGVSGGTGASGPLTALWDATPGCGPVFLIAPINDHNVPNDYALSAMKANLQAAIDAINAMDLTAIVLTSHPHDSAFTPAWTTKQLDYQDNIRDWLMAKAGTPGVIPIDISDVFLDRSTGLATAASLKDGTHWTVTSAYLVAKRVVDAVLDRFPPVNVLPNSNRDRFSADNPRGNLLANGMLLGAAGTISAGGATASGQVADGWSLVVTNGAGLTVTPSKVSQANGDWQQIAISGTTGSSSDIRVELYPTSAIALANAPIGSVLDAVMEMEVDAGAANVHQIGFGPTGGGQFYFDGAMASAARTSIPAVAFSGVQRVPAWTVPAGAANVLPRLRIVLPPSVTVALTARVRAAAVRRVA